MSLSSINTNISSLLAQRSINSSSTALNKSLERLSSGYKINSSADDAAGLSIAQKLYNDIKGQEQASENIQTATNVLQIAEGSLSTINENLQRIRDLSLQAVNGTIATTEKDAILLEIKARLSEIDRLAKSTAYGKISLLSGSTSNFLFQVGTKSSISVNTINVGSFLTKATLTSLGIDLGTITGNLWTQNSIRSYISVIDGALRQVAKGLSNIGACENRLESVLANLEIIKTSTIQARSRIIDTDVAAEASNMTKYSILKQASMSILSQANQLPSMALALLG